MCAKVSPEEDREEERHTHDLYMCEEKGIDACHMSFTILIKVCASEIAPEK